MWKVLPYLLVFVVGALSRRHRVRLCPHQLLPMEESFFLVPQLANVTGVVVNSPRVRNTYLSGDRTCRPLNNMGGRVCPWHYRINFDPDREPKFVTEAVCSCRQCRQMQNSTCQSVTVPRTVLRRRQGNSCMSWMVEAFSVACTCNISSMQSSSPIP